MSAKPLVTFTQSGTSDDGYPLLRFSTPYGSINVKVNSPDHMTVSTPRGETLTVFGVEVHGNAVVMRKPFNEEHAEWSRIDYNARYWRRRHDANDGQNQVSSSARARLDALTLEAVHVTLRVRPNIIKDARVAVLLAERNRIDAEVADHHKQIAEANARRVALDAQLHALTKTTTEDKPTAERIAAALSEDWQ